MQGVILLGRGHVNRQQQWQSGDCFYCWAHWAGWGAILGGKFYILGVVGYNIPIWDVLALEGEREEAGERFHGAKLINSFPIRQAVPVGLAWARFCCWARWDRIFIEKNVYCSTYSIFIYNILFYQCLSRREWMDGVGSVWMTTSQLGKRSQLGFGFWYWAHWARFFIKTIVNYNRYINFFSSREVGMGQWLWIIKPQSFISKLITHKS